MTDQYAGEEVGFQKWIFGFDLKEEKEDLEDKLLHIYTQTEKKTNCKHVSFPAMNPRARKLPKQLWKKIIRLT